MKWYELKDSDKLESPCLLVFPKRIQYNGELMVKIAKHPDRLRPHIKTHKMAEIIQMQLDLGISKFKCATIAEAELLAKCGAPDILLAMQPVSFQFKKYLQLIEKYPTLKLSTLVDNEKSHQEMSASARSKGLKLRLWLDVNNGMNRTGLEFSERTVAFFISLYNDTAIELLGLHVYDGHIHQSDPEQRTIACHKDFQKVENLIVKLQERGIPKPLVIAGGTPTFPIHAKRTGVELSPGTPLLWDKGYGQNFLDLEFLFAAVIMTRIVSKPTKNLLCFDLGHKAVASEMSLPRVEFLGNHNFNQVSQSEEHLVVSCPDTEAYNIGQAFYVVPIHICPTVSKYPHAYTVENHQITGSWQVAARDH